MTAANPPIRVLMVCLGNICRSPTAEGVLRKLLHDQGLQHVITVDSAGTSGWHDGEPPDRRTILAASRRGYDLSQQRSRKVEASDFEQHQYILAMDDRNLRDLQSLCPPHHRSKLGLLLQYGNSPVPHVPDPYEKPAGAFDIVLDLCENSCSALLLHLVKTHGLAAERGHS